VQLTIIGHKGFRPELADAGHDWVHIVQVQALEIPAVTIARKCQKIVTRSAAFNLRIHYESLATKS
jgi:hypothetical protein